MTRVLLDSLDFCRACGKCIMPDSESGYCEECLWGAGPVAPCEVEEQEVPLQREPNAWGNEEAIDLLPAPPDPLGAKEALYKESS